ncbi:hypothetical protein PoB_001049600, partial [Plakobranchus ocellatus]
MVKFKRRRRRRRQTLKNKRRKSYKNHFIYNFNSYRIRQVYSNLVPTPTLANKLEAFHPQGLGQSLGHPSSWNPGHRYRETPAPIPSPAHLLSTPYYDQVAPPRLPLSSNYPMPTGHPLNVTSQHHYNALAYQNLYSQFYNSLQHGHRLDVPAPPSLMSQSVAISNMPPYPNISNSPNTDAICPPVRFLTNGRQSLNDIKTEVIDHSNPSTSTLDSNRYSLEVKTESCSPSASPLPPQIPEESDMSHLDVPPPTVQVDVVGIDEDGLEPIEESQSSVQKGTLPSHHVNTAANIDSGIVSDLSSNTTGPHQTMRSDTVSPPAAATADTEQFKTPDVTPNDSACFVTPSQHPPGKELFPGPVGASTPMEDENLWRPWNSSASNVKYDRDHELPSAATSQSNDVHRIHLSSRQNLKRSYPDSYLNSYRCVPVHSETHQFLSPVLPPVSSRYPKHRRRDCSPSSHFQSPSNSFSIAAMLSKDHPAESATRTARSLPVASSIQSVHTNSLHAPSSSTLSALPVPLAVPQPCTNPQPYGHSLSHSFTVPPPGDSVNNLAHTSSHPIQPIPLSLNERLAYGHMQPEQFYRPPQLLPPFAPNGIMTPQDAIAATFKSEVVPNATQPYQLPGYLPNQPAVLSSFVAETSAPSAPEIPSPTETEALDLSEGTRSRSAPEPPLPSPQNPTSSSAEDEVAPAHPSTSHDPQSSSPPTLTQMNPVRVQPASIQPIPGVVLSVPPPGARPASAFVHTKRLVPKSVLLAAKRRQARAEEGQAKKRDRPPQFGEGEIEVLDVRFFDSPEKSRFCNENGEFVVPKVPDSRDDQDELRDALCRLYAESNLPKVPPALVYNVHALAYYPFMQHLFH